MITRWSSRLGWTFNLPTRPHTAPMHSGFVSLESFFSFKIWQWLFQECRHNCKEYKLGLQFFWNCRMTMMSKVQDHSPGKIPWGPDGESSCGSVDPESVLALLDLEEDEVLLGGDQLHHVEAGVGGEAPPLRLLIPSASRLPSQSPTSRVPHSSWLLRPHFWIQLSSSIHLRFSIDCRIIQILGSKMMWTQNLLESDSERWLQLISGTL